MNTVTNAESSYYTANVNEKTEKGPCVAMTPASLGWKGLNRPVSGKWMYVGK